jgi:hypothetical protein
MEIWLHSFFDLGTRRGEWSASRSDRFTPTERVPGTHWIGGWVGPRAVLDTVKRKIPSPRRESNPRTLIDHPVAQCYTEYMTFLKTFPPKSRSFSSWTYGSIAQNFRRDSKTLICTTIGLFGLRNSTDCSRILKGVTSTSLWRIALCSLFTFKYMSVCLCIYPTPWSRDLLKKLTVTQLVRKLPAFYGNRRFIIVFTRSCHWFLSWTTWIHSTPSYLISLRSILMLSSHLRPHFTCTFSDRSSVWIFHLPCVLNVPPIPSSLIWSP